MAAAYAEAGQFDEAIKSQKKAIELLGPKADEQRKAMQARLRLYKAGKPFRTEGLRGRRRTRRCTGPGHVICFVLLACLWLS